MPDHDVETIQDLIFYQTVFTNERTRYQDPR